MTRADPLRTFLLAVLLISITGVGIELLLLEHTESRTQLVPLAVLAVGLLGAAVVAIAPTRASLLALRFVMCGFIAAGILGLYLHYRGNVQFELEMQPALTGIRLTRQALQGATPTLAPGVMVQLGLLGLAVTFRHPALLADLAPGVKVAPDR